MKEFRFVASDNNRRKALYLLGNMRLKGFTSEHATDGLYWFNTSEGIEEDKRDLLVSATELKILIRE